MKNIIKQFLIRIMNYKKVNIVIEKNEEISNEPVNPIDFSEAEKLCSICVVRPICSKMCEEVLVIYRSHIVHNPNFRHSDMQRKYPEAYRDAMKNEREYFNREIKYRHLLK